MKVIRTNHVCIMLTATMNIDLLIDWAHHNDVIFSQLQPTSGNIMKAQLLETLIVPLGGTPSNYTGKNAMAEVSGNWSRF